MSAWRRSHDLTVVLLAFASGATDVLSFLALLGTFTSAMTGNTALLGLALGQGRIQAAERSFTAFVGFVVGVVIGMLPPDRGDVRPDLVRILGLEAICLLMFTGIWMIRPSDTQSSVIYVLILFSAAGMGLQSVAARRMNLPGIPTVVFTSTLTNIVAAGADTLLGRGPFPFSAKRQLAVFAAYVVGTLFAGVLATHNLEVLILLPLGAVLAALFNEITAPTT